MHGNTEKEKLFVLRMRGAEGKGGPPDRSYIGSTRAGSVLSLFHPLMTKISVDSFSSLVGEIGLEWSWSLAIPASRN